jgi:hypothetical protein
MKQRAILLLILFSGLMAGCYLRHSYTLDEYRSRSEPLQISSVTKTNGEKVLFAHDEGQFDPMLERVYGPVAHDSEAKIPSRDVGIVNVIRPNPMVPVFEGILIGAGVVLGIALISLASTPHPTW